MKTTKNLAILTIAVVLTTLAYAGEPKPCKDPTSNPKAEPQYWCPVYGNLTTQTDEQGQVTYCCRFNSATNICFYLRCLDTGNWPSESIPVSVPPGVVLPENQSFIATYNEEGGLNIQSVNGINVIQEDGETVTIAAQ